MTFTLKDKLTAVQREITMRRKVYPRRVGDKRMTQALADREIAVMEEIAADYAKAVAAESPELFA